MTHETRPSERQKQKRKSRLRIKLLEIVLQRVLGSAVYKWQHLNQIHTHRQTYIYTHTSLYKYTYTKISSRTPEWVMSLTFRNNDTFCCIREAHQWQRRRLPGTVSRVLSPHKNKEPHKLHLLPPSEQVTDLAFLIKKQTSETWAEHDKTCTLHQDLLLREKRSMNQVWQIHPIGNAFLEVLRS